MYFKGFPRFITNKLKTRNMSITEPHGSVVERKGQKAEWGKENIYVDVINFILGLNFISLCFGVW